MADQWVSEADLAEYDAASARAFAQMVGRPAPEAPAPPPWRTGPVGELTIEEYDQGSELTFGMCSGRLTGAREAELRRQVAETDRQIEIEQRLLREASAKDWEAVRTRYSSGRDAEIVESVRKRLGGGTGAQLQESVGAALRAAGVRVELREATAVAPARLGGRRIRATLITPGQGSSGWYPAETLRQAAADRVFPKGLQLFADHPSASEAADRPERSIRDLAGVLTSDARWDGQALVAEAEVFPAFAELITALEGVAGMSIRAQGEIEPGTVDGRPVRKVARLIAPAESVDFVTRAGRGGTYEVLESGRARWAS